MTREEQIAARGGTGYQVTSIVGTIPLEERRIERTFMALAQVGTGGAAPINPGNLTTPTLLEAHARNFNSSPLLTAHQWCWVLNNKYPAFTCSGAEVFGTDADNGWNEPRSAESFLSLLRKHYNIDTANPIITTQTGGAGDVSAGTGGTGGDAGAGQASKQAGVTRGLSMNMILLGVAVIAIGWYAWREMR